MLETYSILGPHWSIGSVGNPPLEYYALLFYDKWHGIFDVSSHTDTVGQYRKAVDYTVVEHWGKVKVVSLRSEADSNLPRAA